MWWATLFRGSPFLFFEREQIQENGGKLNIVFYVIAFIEGIVASQTTFKYEI